MMTDLMAKTNAGNMNFDGLNLDNSCVLIGRFSGKVMKIGSKADCFKWINQQEHTELVQTPSGPRWNKWRSGLTEPVDLFRVESHAGRFKTRQARYKYGIERDELE